MNYLYHGSDAYLVKHRVNTDFNNNHFHDATELKFDELINILITYDPFSSNQIVIVENFNLMKKLTNPETLLKVLKNNKNDCDFVIVFIIYEDSLYRIIPEKIKDEFEIRSVKRLTQTNIISIVSKYCSENKFDIAPEIKNKLIQELPLDGYLLHSSLEKLTLINERITEKHFELIDSSLEENIYRFADNLLKKNRKLCLEQYSTLKAKKHYPIEFLLIICNKIIDIVITIICYRSGMRSDDIQKIIRNPYEYAVKNIKDNINRYNLNELIQLLNDLSKLDCLIKSGKAESYLDFEVIMTNFLKKY